MDDERTINDTLTAADRHISAAEVALDKARIQFPADAQAHAMVALAHTAQAALLAWLALYARREAR